MVTVIMNCHNGERYLRESLNSVFAQSFSDWEIVFWDNASNDKSGEIAKSYGGKVRYFRGDVKVHLGRARNLALKQARGQYIALLDCDDIWLPKKLEEQIVLMEKNKNIGLTYTDCHFFSDGKVVSKPCSVKYPPHVGNVFEALITKRIFIICSAIVFRRDIAEAISNFDESYQSAEEYEFYVKAACITEFGFVNKPWVMCRRHRGSFSSIHKDVTVREVIQTIVKYSPNNASLRLKLRIIFRLAQLHLKLFLLALGGKIVAGVPRNWLKGRAEW